MPRQRERSPQRPKLTDHKMRVLISQYKIRFRGLLSPSQWPGGYPDIFTKIRQIRLKEFDTYETDEATDNRPSVDELKNCAWKLVKVAIKDRKKDTKEAGLRMSTEPLVFERFRTDMKWCVNIFDDVVTSRANLSLSASAAANFSGYLSFRHCQAIPLRQRGCRGDVLRGHSVIVRQNHGFGRIGIDPAVRCTISSTS